MIESREKCNAPMANRGSKLHFIFATALVSQVACWTLATPGPILRAASQGDDLFSFAAATQSCLIAFLCLFAIPLLVSFKLGLKRSDLGLQVGNWKLGFAVLLIGIPLAAVAVLVGGNDAEMLAAYPWPGQWLARSSTNMAAWFSIYAMYYFAFEFFYRGFLLRALNVESGFWMAMWIQVAMSVMIHFGKPTPELLAAIPAGFLFGWIAYKTNSLWYVFVLHWTIGIINDLAAMHYKDWF